MVQLYCKDNWTNLSIFLTAEQRLVYREAPFVMWMVISPELDPNINRLSLLNLPRFLIILPRIILGIFSMSSWSTRVECSTSVSLVMAQICRVNSGILVFSFHRVFWASTAEMTPSRK